MGREVDRGRRGTHQRAVARGPSVRLEVQCRGQVPGVAAGEDRLRLQAHVRGVGGGSAPEPVEDVREFEASALQQ